MNTKSSITAVKLGVSRQIAIPKDIHDELGLMPGDYLDIEIRGNQLILTPKQLIEKRLAEALEDVKAGRVSKPYKNAKSFVAALHRDLKKYQTGHARKHAP